MGPASDGTQSIKGNILDGKSGQCSNVSWLNLPYDAYCAER
jgi:hypothetical protein